MNLSKTSNIPPRIMVVDDERDILSIVKRGLESKKRFQVETFIDAESALESLKENSHNYYDLVLTDIRMPKINGFELYRRIKESNPHMKIVFITAFEINKDEFSKVIPSLDVIDFISKPVSMSTLITKLNSILNHSN
ncbi:MAG TPA: response regulator [Nitrososphaeraceae archaeon]|nr:response regulator [Nitrososphaeraceae archaeon]HSL13423.1 response regulator [Nitrososphaeraceae archaeon]